MHEDMSDAIALLGGDSQYTVTRPVAPANINGIFVPGSTTTFQITASIQPAPGRTLDLLPEGYRGRGGQICFTSTPLRTALSGQVPDLVTYKGELHECVTVETWEELGNYQRIVLVRLPV